MNLLFFTAPDPALMRSDTGRDPLGLLPVWSEIGRKLVPNLAGPVTQIKGVSAVLLIHYVYEKVFSRDGLENEVNFREYFRLMEGLLEWYLWAEGKHCFGAQTFNTGATFSVNFADSRTVVNGLYQYYRGTCRRANLLEEDWTVSLRVGDALQCAWSEAATEQLKPLLCASLGNQRQPMVPANVLEQCSAVFRSLKEVCGSPALNQLLYESLFGAEPHMKLAAYCGELLKAPIDEDSKTFGRTYSLVKKLSNYVGKCAVARPLLGDLKHISTCEPFLIAVQDGFDYLRGRPGNSMAAVASELAEYHDVIAQRAERFLELNGVVKSARSVEMLTIARTARIGMDEFLRAILEHQTSVAEDRGRDPMALLEGDTILALVPPERTKADILQRLKDGYPWDNGYYLATAGNLYQQALETCHV